MKKLLILTVFLVGANTSNAAIELTLAGPELTSDLVGNPDSGLQFTAKENVTLNSFIFQNLGNEDTIQLLDGSGTLLKEYEYLGGENVHQVNIEWELDKGATYTLLALEASNSKFIAYNYTASPEMNMNDHIEITGGYLTGFFDPTVWTKFNNLTTIFTAPIPIPAALWLFGTGVISLLGFKSHRKSKKF